MRRVILAVLTGGALLAAGACGDDPKPAEFTEPAATAAASAPTESGIPSASASVAPSFDYTADNNKVCKRLDSVVTAEFGDFGAALGKMIANKEADQTADAKKLEATAATELKAVATRIRKETTAAQDPKLKQAASATAAKIEASAKNRDFIEKIDTTKDLDTTLKTQVSSWLSPVSSYCGTVAALPDEPAPSTSGTPSAPAGSASAGPAA